VNKAAMTAFSRREKMLVATGFNPWQKDKEKMVLARF